MPVTIKEPERLPPVLSPEEVKRVLTMATRLGANNGSPDVQSVLNPEKALDHAVRRDQNFSIVTGALRVDQRLSDRLNRVNRVNRSRKLARHYLSHQCVVNRLDATTIAFCECPAQHESGKSHASEDQLSCAENRVVLTHTTVVYNDASILDTNAEALGRKASDCVKCEAN